MKSAILGQVWATINIDDVNDVERYYEAEGGLDALLPVIRSDYPDAVSVVLAFALAPAAMAVRDLVAAGGRGRRPWPRRAGRMAR